MVIDPDETARRVRAARAYAGLTREELVRRGPLTYKQLKLVEDGKRRVTTREELLELGRSCGVPEEFMEVGFQGAQQVYRQLARIFAVVLSQDMPAILAEAQELGVDLLISAPDDSSSGRSPQLAAQAVAPRRAAGRS